MIMLNLDSKHHCIPIVVAGYEGYRGRDNRLVVDGDGCGWVADLSPESIPGLLCACNARNLRSYYVPEQDINTEYMQLAVDSYAPVVMSLLPGTFCEGLYSSITDDERHIVSMCQVKNMWLVSRKMVELNTIVSPYERIMLRKNTIQWIMSVYAALVV